MLWDPIFSCRHGAMPHARLVDGEDPTLWGGAVPCSRVHQARWLQAKCMGFYDRNERTGESEVVVVHDLQTGVEYRMHATQDVQIEMKTVCPFVHLIRVAVIDRFWPTARPRCSPPAVHNLFVAHVLRSTLRCGAASAQQRTIFVCIRCCTQSMGRLVVCP